MRLCRTCPRVINHHETWCYPCGVEHRRKRALYNTKWYKAMTPTGLCFWGCGRPATTRDHVIPLSEGGPHTPDNVCYACTKCNYGRGKNGGDPRT